MDWQSAIFAPGWVWSVVSTVLVVGSLAGLYRQLRLQGSQAAIEHFDAVGREFFSERMLRYQLDVLLALRAGVDPAHIPAGAAAAVTNYFEKLGTLARKGHVDAELLQGLGGICRAWWATLAPWIRRTHAEMGTSATEDAFEWLAGRFAELNRRAGATGTFDDAYVRASLDRRIGYAQDMIRVEQSLRAVIPALPEATPAAPPATPAAADA